MLNVNIDDLVRLNDGRLGMIIGKGTKDYTVLVKIDEDFSIRIIDLWRIALVSSTLLSNSLNKYKVGDYVRFSKSLPWTYGQKITKHKYNMDLYKIVEVKYMYNNCNSTCIYRLDGFENIWFKECEITKHKVTKSMIYQKNKEKNNNHILEDFLNSKVSVLISNEAEFEEFVLFLQQRGLSQIMNSKLGGLSWREWHVKNHIFYNAALNLEYDVSIHMVRISNNIHSTVTIKQLIK